MTNNEELYQRLVLFRSHGITRDEKLMTRNEGSWYYQQLDLGYNYRLTDIQCALGVSQFKKLDRFVARRKELVVRYNEAFAEVEGLICPAQADGCNNSWHLYVVQVPNRKELYDKLKEAGINANVHYIPVYKHPYYQENGYADVCCSNAEELYAHMLSLPLYPGLTDEEQDYVIEQVKKILDK